MKMMLDQYGKTVLYLMIAMMIIIPVLFLSLREKMSDLTYDQNPVEYRDNSYLLEYEAPIITTQKDVIKVDVGTDESIMNIKSLFGVKATAYGTEVDIDPVNINYETDFTTENAGIYNITFTCTYVYKTGDGIEIPREGVLNAKILVE